MSSDSGTQKFDKKHHSQSFAISYIARMRNPDVNTTIAPELSLKVDMNKFEINQREFENQWYTRVSQLISPEDRQYFFSHAVQRSRSGRMVSDTQVPGTPAAYSDPQMERLLESLLPLVEQIANRKLYPTYSYFRIYKKGDTLKRHTDRPSCEISVTVNLGHVAQSPWPIWVEGPHGNASIHLVPGDVVVYRGIDCPHWRSAFDGELAAQVFLHYVDQDGPRAEWKFDKRKRLGTVPNGKIHVSPNVHSTAEEDVLVGLLPDKKIKLDPFRARIWREIEADRSIPEIVEHSVSEFGLSHANAESAVMDFISLCNERGIVDI